MGIRRVIRVGQTIIQALFEQSRCLGVSGSYTIKELKKSLGKCSFL